MAACESGGAEGLDATPVGTAPNSDAVDAKSLTSVLTDQAGGDPAGVAVPKAAADGSRTSVDELDHPRTAA
jgi:hypothetical protein